MADAAGESLDRWLLRYSVSEPTRLAVVRVCFNCISLFRCLHKALISRLAVSKNDLDQCLLFLDFSMTLTITDAALDTGIGSSSFSSALALSSVHPGMPFIRRFKPGPPGFLNVELLAAGQKYFSAERIASVYEGIFSESALLQSLNLNASGPSRYYSFSDRCLASGCETLIPAFDVDRSSSSTRLRCWDGLPRARVRMLAMGMGAPREDISKDAIRHPRILAAEAGIRTSCLAVKKSWQNIVSALRCYGGFHSIFLPEVDHFPMSRAALCAFCPLFQNHGTLTQYLGHIRKAEVLMGLEPAVPLVFQKQLLRGIKSVTVVKPKIRYRASAVQDLMKEAVLECDAEAARFYAVAYSWLFRVLNEQAPLQLDGRGDLPADAVDWHSVVAFRANSCKILLRTRKNAPSGDVLRRKCICGSSPCPLCPVCVLRAQVESRTPWRDPSGLIFAYRPERLADLRRRAERLGLPLGGWHSFRRGAAEDLVASGSHIGFILKAGGWRSGAFLRYISASALDTRAASDAFMSLSDSD